MVMSLFSITKSNFRPRFPQLDPAPNDNFHGLAYFLISRLLINGHNNPIHIVLSWRDLPTYILWRILLGKCVQL